MARKTRAAPHLGGFWNFASGFAEGFVTAAGYVELGTVVLSAGLFAGLVFPPALPALLSAALGVEIADEPPEQRLIPEDAAGREIRPDRDPLPLGRAGELGPWLPESP